MAGQKQPFTEKQIKILKKILSAETNKRDLVMFTVQLDSMMRSSDLLRLRVKDVINNKGEVKAQIQIKQKKTGEGHTIRLQADTQQFLLEYIEQTAKSFDDYLFTGRNHTGKPITYNGHAKTIRKWADMLGLDIEQFNTHSLRRTKASIIYEKTNNIEVARQLLGHRSVASTSTYLNISKQAALDIAEQFTL